MVQPDPGGDPNDIDCKNCQKGVLERIKDAQLVCENGHQLNEAFFSIPGKNAVFCDEFGSKTIYKCQNCDWEIPGNSLTEGADSVVLEFPKIPDYCSHCGKAFPWEVYRRGILADRGMDVPPKTKATKEDYLGHINKSPVVPTPKLPKLALEDITKIRAVAIESFSKHSVEKDDPKGNIDKLLLVMLWVLFGILFSLAVLFFFIEEMKGGMFPVFGVLAGGLFIFLLTRRSK